MSTDNHFEMKKGEKIDADLSITTTSVESDFNFQLFHRQKMEYKFPDHIMFWIRIFFYLNQQKVFFAFFSII
jgi:hypothetical protein